MAKLSWELTGMKGKKHTKIKLNLKTKHFKFLWELKGCGSHMFINQFWFMYFSDPVGRGMQPRG